MEYNSLLQEAKLNQVNTQKHLNQMESMAEMELDGKFQKAHQEVFAQINCLSCANCCKTTSPIIEQEDISLVASHLNISRSDLIIQYLEMDEDGDFVFKHAPCPFLDQDNRCKVYDSRPKACREYPHTNRKPIKPILDIMMENSLICPAVYSILNKIQTEV